MSKSTKVLSIRSLIHGTDLSRKIKSVNKWLDDGCKVKIEIKGQNEKYQKENESLCKEIRSNLKDDVKVYKPTIYPHGINLTLEKIQKSISQRETAESPLAKSKIDVVEETKEDLDINADDFIKKLKESISMGPKKS